MKLRFWLIAKLYRSRVFWAVFVLVLSLCFRFYSEYQAILSVPVSSWQKNQGSDCAVVLTGGAGRVREGFDLLANQAVKKLIISGVYSNVQLRELMPMWSFYGNLNENDVVLEKRSETTYGNAQQSLAIVEALKCRDVLLVTSRLHMHRAYRSFRATFPETIYIHPHSVISGRYETSVWENSLEALKSLFYSIWAY